MIRVRRLRRAVLRGWSGFAALAFALLLPTTAAAQEPGKELPADTLATDTLVVPIPPGQVEADTLPSDSVLESEEAAFVLPFPVFPDPQPEGWAPSRWEWDRDELLRWHGLSLLDLLEQIPGIVVTRAGAFGRPTAVTAFGLGGSRLRVFIDGWEMDPLGASTLDLQNVPLVDLLEVRVERSLLGVRVDITTFRLPEPAPFALVEIGTGNEDVNLVRALFSRPFGPRNVLTAGGTLLSTDGVGIREPFRLAAAKLAWSRMFTRTAGLQLEYRADAVQRETEDTLFAADFSRRDLILRGRAEPLRALALDAMVGRSTRDAEAPDPEAPDTEFAATQAALRAGYTLPMGALVGTARYRAGQTGFPQPELDLSARAVLQPLPWVLAEGGVRSTALDGLAGTELQALGRIGPVAGLSLFGSFASGSRVSALVRTEPDTALVVGDSIDGEEVIDTLVTARFVFPARVADAGGVRLGGEWTGWGGIQIGAARLTLAEAEAVPFGFGFLDAPLDPVSAGSVSGWEAFWDIPLPLFRRALHLTGWYTRWDDAGERPFLPQEQAVVGLRYHDVYIDGQLEPTLRLDAVRRGSAVVPDLGALEPGFTGTSDPYTVVNLFLQLRIVDLRAFLLWENAFSMAGVRDLPGTPQRRPVLVYGVRWHFWN